MPVTGAWTAITDSPVGKQTMQLQLSEEGSVVTGTASTGDEVVDVSDGALDGNTLTFTVAVSKPMKIGMKFTVDVDGDAFAGKVKAGFFPAMNVVATRS